MVLVRASAAEPPTLRCRTAHLPTRPHIAVFMADDLGFLDVSYAGSSLVATPNLDALARRATVLTHFRAPTWCAPSRAAFMTGRHGWEVGMSSAMGWTALGRDSMLLPAVLGELGYRTAVVGKLHLNPRTCLRHHTTGGPFGCGFDHQYGFVGGMSDYWEHHQTWSRDGTRLRESGYMTSLLAAEAERLVHAHVSFTRSHTQTRIIRCHADEGNAHAFGSLVCGRQAVHTGTARSSCGCLSTHRMSHCRHHAIGSIGNPRASPTRPRALTRRWSA